MSISCEDSAKFWRVMSIFNIYSVWKNKLKSVNYLFIHFNIIKIIIDIIDTFNMAASILLFSFGKTSRISGLKLSVLLLIFISFVVYYLFYH
jgi:hypothetical protein